MQLSRWVDTKSFSNFCRSARGYPLTPHEPRPKPLRRSTRLDVLEPTRERTRTRPLALTVPSSGLCSVRTLPRRCHAHVWPRRTRPLIAPLARDRTAGLTLGRPRSTSSESRALREQCTYTRVLARFVALTFASALEPRLHARTLYTSARGRRAADCAYGAAGRVGARVGPRPSGVASTGALGAVGATGAGAGCEGR